MVAIGETLSGTYRVYELVGGGAFADVYLGRDIRTNTVVALKILHPHFVRDPSIVQRFLQEARTAYALADPHIVRVLDADQDGDTHYIVMEYVQGQTLAHLVQTRGPLPMAEAVGYADQVLQGLDTAHRAGVVHRDIKPHNLMVTGEGLVKIMDFGIAKQAAAGTMTRAGQPLGTPQYMSPEQANGERADARSDLYAVAATLFELLTGRPPFNAENPWDVLRQQMTAEPPLVRSLRSDIPTALESAVDKGLQKNPASRFQGAEEFRRALRTSAGAWSPQDERTEVSHSIWQARRKRGSSTEAKMKTGAYSVRPKHRPAPLARIMGGAGILALAALVAFWIAGPPGQTVGPRGALAEPAAPENSDATRTSDIIGPQEVVATADPASSPELPKPRATSPENEWIVIGHSFQGREIQMIRLGDGPVRLALMGSIHGGWERNTRLLVQTAYEYFLERPAEISPRLSVYFVPSTNPDGLAVGNGPDAAWNTRGVDLNRNFDTRDWSPDTFGRVGGRYGPTGTRRGAGGAAPFSEPETQTIREFVRDHGIEAVLSYHSGIESVSAKDGGGGLGEPLAKIVERFTRYPYIPVWTEYKITGQFMDWLDDAGVKGVEIDLPNQFSIDWPQNLASVKGVMAELAAG